VRSACPWRTRSPFVRTEEDWNCCREREDAIATAAIRAALAKRGTPIGPYDLMIAGSALRRGLVMVTSNASEFERIRGLILQDWRNGVAVPRDI
jgi:predicted nucleic acid-binding protein